MAASYRELRPAPVVEDQQQASPRDLLQRGRNRAALACQRCKEKRQKCSGERPECRECRRRCLTCVYAARLGQTRMASLRENNERMKSDLDTMMELYWYLQTRPKQELGDVLSAIQTGTDPSGVVEAIKSRKSALDLDTTSSSSAPSATCAQSETRLAPEQGPTSSSTQPSQSVFAASSHDTQTFTEPWTNVSPSSETITQSQLARTIESLGKGTEAFFTCTGCIFHIYDQNEAEASFDDLRPYLENSGKSWLELVHQGLIPSYLKPAFCSLCIMAAVGLQYAKNPIPALGLVPSSSNGSYQCVSVFYESARYLLESVIETNLLEAMRVCAALTLFNTIGHATVAIAYADMGINFVKHLGSSLQFRPRDVSEELWIKHKRVARTLVTLRNWLASTLGYVHKDHAGLQSEMHWLMEGTGMMPDETIQQELNKVVHIEANLLRTIGSFRELSPVLLGSTKNDLDQWQQQLPGWMHLSALSNPSGNAKIMRRTVYLVHLFYLSASMLLARLAHGARGNTSSDAAVLLPRYDIEEVRIAAGDGVRAARTVARILQLQMDEQTLYERCWLCEFSAYTACLTLLHSTAQMQLHDCSERVWRNELAYAQSCLSVLEHCGKADKVAAHFENISRSFYGTIAAQAQPLDDMDILNAPRDLDYLFSLPLSSPAQLVQTSQDLLKRISCPFGSPSSLYEESTLKAGLGVHTTLPIDNTPQKEAKSWSAVEMALSSMPTGQFIGAAQPHGWDMFLNIKAL